MGSPATREQFARFAWIVLAYTLLVVLWGALVRATGSGAGCGSHWPLCNGDVVPRAPTTETLIEYTHRLTSGLAMLAVVVLWVRAYRIFPRGHSVRLFAVLSAVFIFVEALLGAGLVLLRYVGQDASVGRAVYLAAHLVNTKVLLAVLALTAWAALAPAAWPGWWKGPRLLLLAVPLVLIVSATGAVTALGDTLFPASSVGGGPPEDAATHFLVQLRVLHPALAVFIGAFLLYAASSALRMREPAVRKLALALGALVFVQLMAGMINIALLAPVWMQIVHLLLANLLWLALILLVAEAAARPAITPSALPRTARAAV